MNEFSRLPCATAAKMWRRKYLWIVAHFHDGRRQHQKFVLKPKFSLPHVFQFHPGMSSERRESSAAADKAK